jgi:hypothetical protein
VQLVELLLSNDCEMGGYTRPFLANGSVTHSRSNRHESNNRRTVFSMWSVPRCHKLGRMLELSLFCTGVCEERT